MEITEQNKSYDKAFVIGDTRFSCTILFNDTFDHASDSDVDGVTQGFIKEFFTCKILNEYKVIISNRVVNVTILLKKNSKTMPEHCPWDYLLFVSRSESDFPASAQTDDLPRNHIIQSTLVNSQNSQKDHEQDGARDRTQSNGTYHSSIVEESQTKLTIHIQPVAPCAQNLVNSSESNFLGNNKDPVKDCDVTTNAENSHIASSRNYSSDSASRVKVDMPVLTSGPRKSVNMQRMEKFSSLLAKNPQNLAFSEFESLQEADEWLNNDEIQLITNNSQQTFQDNSSEPQLSSMVAASSQQKFDNNTQGQQRSVTVADDSPEIYVDNIPIEPGSPGMG